MTPQTNNMQDYRESHTSEGYGTIYNKTYANGYYREQWERLEQPLITRILQNMKDSGASSLMDFACGTGRILAIAEEMFPVPTGVDVSGQMLEICRKKCNHSNILKQDITHEPLDDLYDVITSFRFFLNADSVLRKDALLALRTMLAPGGSLVINVHVNSGSPLGLAYRFRNRVLGRTVANVLGHSEIQGLLHECGYKTVDTYWYSYLPRTGPWIGWLPKVMMNPVEKLCENIPLLKKTAQCYLMHCVAEENGGI